MENMEMFLTFYGITSYFKGNKFTQTLSLIQQNVSCKETESKILPLHKIKKC
jgi:hypothetical protein